MSRRESIQPPPDGTWLRAVLDAMVEAVLVVDARGRIALTNRALDALTSEDVRGKRAKNVIKNERLREAMRDARKKARATDVEIEASVLGRMRVFRASISPLPKRAGAVAVLHDITPLKEADRTRRDFVANASHELRTPLTSIRGFAETLVDGALAEPETSARFLAAILRQTKRLQRLAEDLASLARAESSEEPLPAATIDLTACGCASRRLGGSSARKRTPRRPSRSSRTSSRTRSSTRSHAAPW
jgi:two-component system phosphate regulon sensor histidine kinase PhoR